MFFKGLKDKRLNLYFRIRKVSRRDLVL
jgi:hypothetical protein